MSDYYTEQLVKKRTSMKDVVVKAFLVALTIVSVLVVFMFPFGIIAPVIIIVLDVIMFQRMDVEYEYLFVNGDLDVDKIMHKAKRKRIFTININDIEIVAPSDSPELNQYRGIKANDYSSMESGAKTYTLVAVTQGEQKKIIFEPNDTIIEGLRMLAPRKVIR